ncbi:uncharacterized protein DUF4439 [Nocardioides sp. J9]|uniref:ferritin-like domain-containing protein n=1 Tax=Nocardioides sp. J9 TaxID=935844 RepID=UPI0011A5B251|nr:ferritin-like domain-containing protein [Nocardioides sp. J9]TWH01616.1 uncharacterized protein DUF4439 [Nocardioides sp. J9]
MTDPAPTTPDSATTPDSPASPGTTTPGAAGPDGGTEALQTALAAEHAAVFVYGALGAQASRSAQPALFGRLTAAYRLHRTRRDELVSMIRDAGAEPVAAEPGYQLPRDLGTAAALEARARRLEQDAARTYAWVVASTTGEPRAWAVEALLDAAVRGLGFGAKPQSLPGLQAP